LSRALQLLLDPAVALSFCSQVQLELISAYQKRRAAGEKK
jgi:hypothetical protein